MNGRVFYVGIKKDLPKEHHNSKTLYTAVLREVIKRLDQHCSQNDCKFFMLLDEKEKSFRSEIVREAAIQMYGHEPRKNLIEPPIQAESHLYQSLQCADWLCGLIGRYVTYKACPEEYADFEWAEKFFGSRIEQATTRSGIRH